MTRESWLRAGLAVLAIGEIVPGVWAVVDPAGWYRSFPGFGRHWVSIDGPYNHHLATDAGAGFLAVGVALVIALVLLDRRVLLAALAAYLVKEVPHTVYHLGHGAHLSTADRVLGTGSLVLGVVLGVVLLVAASRRV